MPSPSATNFNRDKEIPQLTNFCTSLNSKYFLLGEPTTEETPTSILDAAAGVSVTAFSSSSDYKGRAIGSDAVSIEECVGNFLPVIHPSKSNIDRIDRRASTDGMNNGYLQNTSNLLHRIIGNHLERQTFTTCATWSTSVPSV
ncbi:hypothetical protein HO133_009552 [Letharia lupina]|uniref:Uncharacterized protein n=1 Tax=Letharia lupina TaxID=560253 RepID=A0A8H6CLF7_9LECA|nr:uncharacterized protein HO133_009552 [Letharia lupina]KAF6225552.1 hypothetical protein HO133_009552 [Letharia lupina]